MEFIVWVETRLAGRTLAVEEVTKFDRRAAGIVPEEIGLTLQEGRRAAAEPVDHGKKGLCGMLGIPKSEWTMVSAVPERA
jgi:hypothetical protein